MEIKKDPKKDMNLLSRTFLFFGLILSVSVTLVAFNWNFEDSINRDELASDKQEFEEIQDIPPTMQEPPPPPELIVAPEINEVEDEEIEDEIEEIIFIEDKKDDNKAKTAKKPKPKPKPKKKKVEEPKEDEIFQVVEESAEPEGGMEAFYKYVGKNLKYPSVARRMGIEGKVFVQFVVEKDGSFTDVQVVKGISPECDEEAARIFKEYNDSKKAPKWSPGKQRGRAVRQKMVIPIHFKLK